MPRAAAGFSIPHLVAEYRALRASVLRSWADATAWTEVKREAAIVFRFEQCGFFGAWLVVRFVARTASWQRTDR